MFDERLFYYIHGFATMFFLLEGLRRFRNKKGERLNRICGYILLYWSILEFKDLLLLLVWEDSTCCGAAKPMGLNY